MFSKTKSHCVRVSKVGFRSIQPHSVLSPSRLLVVGWVGMAPPMAWRMWSLLEGASIFGRKSV